MVGEKKGGTPKKEFLNFLYLLLIRALKNCISH